MFINIFRLNVAVLLILLGSCQAFAQRSVNKGLEEKAQRINKELECLDPAQIAREDRTAIDLIEQLEGFGLEARCAIPSLKKFASQKDLVGYRSAAMRASVRQLAQMGPEGINELSALLKNARGETRYWMLSELESLSYLDFSPLFLDLVEIANLDQSRPSAELVAAEIATFQEDNPNVDLNSGFSQTSGSESLDKFRQVEIDSRIAVDIILGCRELRSQATGFFVERATRKENPSLEGLESLVGNSKIASLLLQIALETEDPDWAFGAADCLAQVDPLGRHSFPVLLEQFASSRSDPDFRLARRAARMLKAHPSRHTIEPSSMKSAIESADESVQVELTRLLMSEATQDASLVREQFQLHKDSEPRKAHEFAAKLIQLDPNNDEAVDFLLRIVADKTGSEQAQTARGFNRIAPPNPRPLAARELGYVGPNHRERVLKELRKLLIDDNEAGAKKRRPTDLVVSAAWSVAQLDRSDRDCLRFVDRIPFPFSNASVRSPLHGKSGRFVSEMLGERVELFAEKLVVQALNYDFNKGESAFAREILFNAKPPESNRRYVEMLVKQAFRKIKGIAKQKRVDDRSSQAIAIKFLLDHSSKLKAAFDTICEECSSPNYESRKMAIRLLGELQHEPQKSVAILSLACKDERAMVRIGAARSLAKFGQAANSALKQIRALKSDEYESVRTAAAQAFAMIEE